MEMGWLGTGPKVKRFEEDFGKYKGVPHTAALNSCTAGLHLSCAALDLQSTDEVITSSMTFCATVNAIIHSGATPVIADVDPDTFNISPEAIEKKITDKTRAIIPVHFAGRACRMDEIMDLAQRYNLEVIEDCAHAIETEYRGQKAGTFGNVSIYSASSVKTFDTYGGGLAFTSDLKLGRSLRNHQATLAPPSRRVLISKVISILEIPRSRGFHESYVNTNVTSRSESGHPLIQE
jgi:dTDP-4-amino-4,6-dideoxygalactose transaminase